MGDEHGSLTRIFPPSILNFSKTLVSVVLKGLS